VRATRGLRAFLVAVVLATVGAASTLDGEAADLVAGDDGDALITRRQETPSISMAAALRPRDVCASRQAPFLAAIASPGSVRRKCASPIETVGVDAPGCPGASEPLPSRAPPVV